MSDHQLRETYHPSKFKRVSFITYIYLEPGRYQRAPNSVFQNTGWGKRRFTVVSMRNKAYSIIKCIIFHMNNCKPTFAPPCICHRELVGISLSDASLD